MAIDLQDPIGMEPKYWKKYDGIILPVGAPGTWDDTWAFFGSIVKSGSTYYGYYSGRKSNVRLKIGLATSTDGFIWTKHPSNPIIALGSAGQFDDLDMCTPLVWIEGSTWHMLYAAYTTADNLGRIGYATSSDGITWVKSGSNPVFSPSANGNWDDYAVGPGHNMIKEGSIYYLFYKGNTNVLESGQIGLATSTNLTSWTRSQSTPVLSRLPESEKEYGLLEPSVYKFGSMYYMFYQGNQADELKSYVHSATSTDKMNWTRNPDNPILSPRSDKWDSLWTESPVLLNLGNQWVLHYGGYGAGSPGAMGNEGGYAKYLQDVFPLVGDFERISLPAVNSTLTDFPVLVPTPASDSAFWANVQADGSDIEIFDANGNFYNHDLISINVASKALQLRVKKTLTTLGQTLYMRVGYGRSLSYAPLAWESNFLAVYPGENVNDRTKNANHLTNNGGIVFRSGQVGNEFYNDNIAKSLSRDGMFNYDSNQPFTVRFWVKLDVGASYAGILDHANPSNPYNGIAITKYNNDSVRLSLVNYAGSNALIWQSDAGTVTVNTRMFLSITYAGDNHTATMRKNGAVLPSSRTADNLTGTVTWAGAMKLLTKAGLGPAGGVDELMMSTVVRSADWQDTEYANENNPNAWAAIAHVTLTPPVAQKVVSGSLSMSVGIMI